MKKILLSLIIIVAIEFHLSWAGSHNPNWVRALDQYGNEVPLIEERIQKDNVWHWSVKSYDGQYNWDFNFWEL